MAVNLWQMWLRLKDERHSHFQTQDELHSTKDLMHQALDNAARADERAEDVAKIHQELLSRPIQAMIPMGAIETIANAVAQYLNESGHEIIWPTKKDKLQ
jgi:hypothetical protein